MGYMGTKLRVFFFHSWSLRVSDMTDFFFLTVHNEHIAQSVNSFLPSDKSRDHRHIPESRLMSLRFQMWFEMNEKNENANPKVMADPWPQEERDILSENVVRCGTRDYVCDIFQILRIFTFLFKPTLHFLLLPSNKLSFIYWWWN